MSLSNPWIDYDPRVVGLDADKGAVRYMLDRANLNAKRDFIKLSDLGGDPLNWLEERSPQFLVMTANPSPGYVTFDPTLFGLAGSVGDVYLGPGLGLLCWYEKAGTDDFEWARISDTTRGVPPVVGAGGTKYLTDQGWAAFPGLGGLAVGTRTPGDFTLTDKQFSFVDGRLILSGTQRGTLSGDSRVQILGRR